MVGDTAFRSGSRMASNRCHSWVRNWEYAIVEISGEFPMSYPTLMTRKVVLIGQMVLLFSCSAILMMLKNLLNG